MPYSRNSDLPDSVRKHLPSAAQTLFRKAFNSAHSKYKSEVIAFKVAWIAVKMKYKKNKEGKWVRE